MIRTQEDITLLLKYLLTSRQKFLFRRNKLRNISLKHPNAIVDSASASDSAGEILRPKVKPTEIDRIMTRGILSPKRTERRELVEAKLWI